MLLKQAIINLESVVQEQEQCILTPTGEFIIYTHNYIVLSTCNPITRHAIQETSYQLQTESESFKKLAISEHDTVQKSKTREITKSVRIEPKQLKIPINSIRNHKYQWA